MTGAWTAFWLDAEYEHFGLHRLLGFHNKTVAERDALAADVDRLRADLAAANDKVMRLVRGEMKTQICSYCGWESNDGAAWEDLQCHVRTCKEHPLAQALSDLAARDRRIKELEHYEAKYAVALERCRKDSGPCWCGQHLSEVMADAPVARKEDANPKGA